MKRTGKRTGRLEKPPAREEPPVSSPSEAAADSADPVSFSNLSLHELFEQQARTMLESADIDEEQKQGILVAMACPCCGAGGMSFSVKLRTRGSRDTKRDV